MGWFSMAYVVLLGPLGPAKIGAKVKTFSTNACQLLLWLGWWGGALNTNFFILKWCKRWYKPQKEVMIRKQLEMIWMYLNVLNILSPLMPLFFPFSMMSEHQESVLKYIPANLRRYFTSLRFFFCRRRRMVAFQFLHTGGEAQRVSPLFPGAKKLWRWKRRLWLDLAKPVGMIQSYLLLFF